MRLSIARSRTETGPGIPSDWRAMLAEMPEHVREAWEERAAIIEYDGNEPRPTAERRAFQCVIDQFEDAKLFLKSAAAAGASSPSKRRRA